ncbi:MAG: hypothetical protein JHC70_03670 [Rhodococcus sp.]|jgi:transcriptional regulator with XRE-family HTH domain|nr:hypothetical protein [Rhodococcus sp. (in: high G+C Gram-positive bacteria)]MBJ7321424.1 hypothetical protein [Rhodococcus sp. (in: high G+C Gram-positive bacteria)]
MRNGTDMHISTPPMAHRINRLFECNRAAADPEDTSTFVAGALSVATKVAVSAGYIDELRSGRDTGPYDSAVLEALAVYFDAPTSYLATQWDEEAFQYDEELTLLAQLRNNGIQMLAMRDGGAANTTELIEILNQLPDQPPTSDRSH